MKTSSSKAGAQATSPCCSSKTSNATGALIVNADDWGRERRTTDAIAECVRAGSVSSVSAMVFMSDSERAAEIAHNSKIDAGLHLNFTAAFSSPAVPPRVAEQQRRLRVYLRTSRFAGVLFHPGLADSFRYVVEAQLEEFHRRYGAGPSRVDGHHHVQLCSNVILGRLLPPGIVVRRNFSFQPGEKSVINRLYRKGVDCFLSRRYRLVDFLFNLVPLEPSTRMERIVLLARRCVVELETHPANPEEYHFLTGGQSWLSRHNMRIASCFDVSPANSPTLGIGNNHLSKSRS
jgi:hypothetical protein